MVPWTKCILCYKYVPALVTRLWRIRLAYFCELNGAYKAIKRLPSAMRKAKAAGMWRS
jgi:hypothetical protein